MHPDLLLPRSISMEGNKSTEKITNSFVIIEPPKYLKNAIFKRIAVLKQKQAIRKKILFWCGFFVCGAGFLAGATAFVHAITASDFGSIFSLSFTDMGAVISYWQEYALSLLETFPAETFVYLIAPILLALILAKQYFSSYKYTNSIQIYKYTK